MAVATLPNGASISADAHPKQIELGLRMAATARAAGRLWKNPTGQSGPRGMMQTVQTGPDQMLKELQSIVGSAADWINPNTGKRVSGRGGGVKAGGNLLGAMASGLGMLTGGYKGAVSSGAGGIMQQALGIATGSVGVAAIVPSVVKSLGGGGGGISSLIANKSGIGISIPRFGGIPAVRGAGFQIRSVGYNRPRSSRRGAGPGGAEGGGAEEAGVD